MAFKYAPKGSDPPAETKAMDAMPGEEEGEGDDKEPTYTRAELGALLIRAVKSGDGEAVYEAWKKMSDGTPSD